jgi:hypothetical protein
MTLNEALHILADHHTCDDDVTGYTVETTPKSWHASHWSQADYINAWRVVREHLHLQTEPKRLSKRIAEMEAALRAIADFGQDVAAADRDDDMARIAKIARAALSN